jgi:tetratricopeptide (TPR) repeat protein/predicted Ser/Thr protein kinase
VLEQLLDEALDAETLGAVEAHVETCDPCKESLARLTSEAAWSWFLEAPLPELARPPADGAARSEGPAAVPGYEILGELGHGAHGVVYEARQAGLNRPVALKVARQGVHASPEERARLRREAEAVARLRHPHVVQVYAVGEHDGAPFFAMELVAGGSLAATLDGTPWPAGRAAELVQTLARAMHAAHEVGIVHRDLKPRNVLLDGDGTPKVTDFGIAKQLDADAGETPSQSILGTPSYMAPEQATGGSRHVGRAADVYALGAILYELLTGRPPFKGETHFETVLQVREQPPVSPRRLQPKVPRDLETVCLKCLAKEPRGRYATALALAEDLGRFLGGEPVLARPVGQAERLYRWCRRNPLVAGLVAGLFVVLAGGLIAVASLWRTAEHRGTRASEAKEEADRQRDRADEVIADSIRALDTYLEKVVSSKELKTPGLESIRQSLMDLVLADYMDYARRRQDDPKLQRRVARLYATAAQIRRDNRQYAEAVAAGEKATELYERLLRDNPDSCEDLRYLAWFYSDMGITLGKLDRDMEALQAYQRALALRQRIVEINPAFPGAQGNLAWSYTEIGTSLANDGRYQEARQYLQKAVAKWPEVCAAEPGRTSARKHWAMACQHLGSIEELTRHPDSALRYYKESHGLFRQLAEKAPGDPEVTQWLGESHARLGRGYRGVSEVDEARRAYEQAADLQEKMLAAYPAAAEHYRKLLSRTLYETAEFEREQGRAARSAALALKRRTLWPGNGAELYDVACHLALCIPLVGRGKADRTAAEEDERRRYADLAMQTLQEAVRLGYQDWEHIGSDKDLDPLRARPDFQALLKTRSAKQAGP